MTSEPQSGRPPQPLNILHKRRILGITKGQMFLVYLVSVFVYMSCIFLFPSTGIPFWLGLTWRDFLTLLAIPLIWVAAVIYNRYNPDEEIHLDLSSPSDDEKK